jgi:hypothetical protein
MELSKGNTGGKKPGRPPGSTFSPEIWAQVEYLSERVSLGPKAIESRLLSTRPPNEVPSSNTIKKKVAGKTRGSKAGEDPWDFLEATPEERLLMGEYIDNEWMTRPASGPIDIDSLQNGMVDERHYPWANPEWPSALVAEWYIALRQLDSEPPPAITVDTAQIAAQDPELGKGIAAETMRRAVRPESIRKLVQEDGTE